MNAKQVKKIRKAIREYAPEPNDLYVMNQGTVYLHPTNRKHLYNIGKKLHKENI